MNKKTIGIIAISVVLGAFILVCVKEKVDDFIKILQNKCGIFIRKVKRFLKHL